MPEGDTIYRTAVTLRAAVQGQLIVSARSRQPGLQPATIGQHRLELVEARGKHLLMHLDDQRVIHSHMGMTGSWHLYRVGEPWRKPESRAALTLVFSHQLVVVCFTPKLLELLPPSSLERHAWLPQLGPDVLASDFDEAEVLRRFRECATRPLGEAIMDQSIWSGVGNVYKSETLFLERLDPFQPVAALDDERLQLLIRNTRILMRRNLEGRARRTRFGRDGHRFWAYGRSGEPCFVCGQRLEMRRQGDLGRSTYFCPTCQQSPPK